MNQQMKITPQDIGLIYIVLSLIHILITTPAVKYRRPYDIYIEEYPHLASFMASVNGNEFLTDPTGSRRFLPFEVLHIDKPGTEAIRMDNVYSEAMYLYRQGVRYWFNDTEIEELYKVSAGFQVQTVEFEMLMQHFEKPEEGEENLFFMTTAQDVYKRQLPI